MNKTYKIVFNRARKAMMVANELTHSTQKTGTKVLVTSSLLLLTGTAIATPAVYTSDYSSDDDLTFSQTILPGAGGQLNGILAHKENTKVALRDAAKKVIPNESYKKKKLGFPVPLRNWMRDDDFYTEIKNTFSKDYVKEFFNQKYIIKLLEQHKNNRKDNYKKVWTIYCFLKWYEIFFLETVK